MPFFSYRFARVSYTTIDELVVVMQMEPETNVSPSEFTGALSAVGFDSTSIATFTSEEPTLQEPGIKAVWAIESALGELLRHRNEGRLEDVGFSRHVEDSGVMILTIARAWRIHALVQMSQTNCSFIRIPCFIFHGALNFGIPSPTTSFKWEKPYTPRVDSHVLEFVKSENIMTGKGRAGYDEWRHKEAQNRAFAHGWES